MLESCCKVVCEGWYSVEGKVFMFKFFFCWKCVGDFEKWNRILEEYVVIVVVVVGYWVKDVVEVNC